MAKRPKIFEAMEPVVWLGSAALVIGFCIYGGLFTESAASVFKALQVYIATQFGWFYILSASFFLGFVVWLHFSPYGNIRLGADDDEPEFSTFAWFTMLFSAGMGIGLVFWGIAEPIMHYQNPPTALGGTPEALAESLRFTFFHWGFHPWAVYITFALGIAYYHFRLGLPLAPRSLLYPIIGERFRGMAGHLVDILCTVGTLFGVATSLGIGSMQINIGISNYTGLPIATNVQIWIIIIITGVCDFLGGFRNPQGYEAPESGQRPAGACTAVVRADCRSHFVPTEGLDHDNRRLPAEHRGDELLDRRREGECLAAQLDNLLLGMVDLLVSLRGDLRRPRFQGADGEGVRADGVSGADRGDIPVARRVRGHRAPDGTPRCR